MKIKGLIFDFGFTLFEFKDVSVENYFECYRKGLRKVANKLVKEKIFKSESEVIRFKKAFNKERTNSFRKSMKTKLEYPTTSIFKNILLEFKVHLPEDISLNELADMYHSFEEEEWIPFSHTKETLEYLSSKHNIKLAVLSNHPHHNTIVNLLEKYDLSKFFDAIVTSAQFGKRKPDPEIFIHTIEQMGLNSPDSCLICDDEHADIAGGHRAGLQTILCKRVYKFPFEKEIDVPNYIKINDISELIEHLK